MVEFSNFTSAETKFSPSLCKNSNCEVAVKYYKKGEYEESHYHKIATEYTVIISGRVKMNGIEYKTGDIIVESTNEHNGRFKVINLIAGSTKVSTTKYYKSRKNERLNVNGDTLRARANKRSFPRWKNVK